MREAFEKWATHHFGEDNVNRQVDEDMEYEDDYNFWPVQDAWEAWKAAWEASRNDNH